MSNEAPSAPLPKYAPPTPVEPKVTGTSTSVSRLASVLGILALVGGCLGALMALGQAETVGGGLVVAIFYFMSGLSSGTVLLLLAQIADDVRGQSNRR